MRLLLFPVDSKDEELKKYVKDVMPFITGFIDQIAEIESTYKDPV